MSNDPSKPTGHAPLPSMSSRVRRAVLCFFLLSLVAAICLAVVMFDTYRRLGDEHLEQLLQVVSVPALMAVDYMDYTVAGEVTKSLEVSPHLVKAALLDEFSRPLAEVQVPGPPYRSPWLQALGVDQLRERHIPLPISDTTAGELRITLNVHSIYGPLADDILLIVLIGLVLCLLAGGYFYYATAFPLKRALVSLLAWARARRQRETQQGLTERSAVYQEIYHFSDEIQRLISALHEQLNLNRIQQKQLMQQAYQDALTGLKNRRFLQDLFKRNDLDGQAYLMFIDIDRFKQINDTWDYQVGDQIICALSNALHRATEQLQHYASEVYGVRFGGDEFLLLAIDREQKVSVDLERYTACAQAIQADFKAWARVPDGRISPSITIALSHLPLRGAAHLKQHFHQINALMSDLKRTQRARVYSIDADELTSVARQLNISRSLDEAAIQAQMHYCYQPVYATDSLAVMGFEALLRWEHPELGSIPPEEFINLVEEEALPMSASRHLVSKFIQDIAKLAQYSWFCKRWRFSLNLSFTQLHVHGFIEYIVEYAERYGISLRQIDIEITERQIDILPERSVSLLSRLHRLGMSVSLDDFGSGFSAWDGLLHLPIDRVKLDKSLLSSASPHHSLSVIKHLVSACRDLQLETVCEGVETSRGYEVARESLCDKVQGYYLAYPLPLEVLIREQQWRHLVPQHRCEQVALVDCFD